LLIFLGIGRFVKIDTELYVIYISGRLKKFKTRFADRRK